MNFWRSKETVFVANVPVSDVINIEVPHVIAVYLADRLTASLDLSSKDILFLPPRWVYVKDAIQFILFILVLQGARQLMRQCPHEDIVEHVSMDIVTDFLAVFELDLFETLGSDCALSQSWFDWK